MQFDTCPQHELFTLKPGEWNGRERSGDTIEIGHPCNGIALEVILIFDPQTWQQCTAFEDVTIIDARTQSQRGEIHILIEEREIEK